MSKFLSPTKRKIRDDIMLFQNDPRFVKSIRKSGCYLLSLFFEISSELQKVFSFEEINKYYTELLDLGYITSECYINNPDAIFRHFGIKSEVRKEDANYKTASNELEISRVEVSGISVGHFVVSHNSNVIYDSMFHTLEGRKLSVVSKRIFKLI